MRSGRLQTGCRPVLAAILLFSRLSASQAGSAEEGLLAFAAKDYNRSFSLLQPLADSKNPGISFLLGKMYLEGRGTERNVTKALALLASAADAGHGTAARVLGDHYRSAGADRKALYWYGRVPEGDDALSMKLADIYRRLGRYDKAFGIYKKLSRRFTVPEPTYEIARMYERGEGRAVNKKAARSLYRAAAKKGYKKARYRLGLLLAESCENPQQRDEALRQLRTAASEIDDARALLEAIESGARCTFGRGQSNN